MMYGTRSLLAEVVRLEKAVTPIFGSDLVLSRFGRFGSIYSGENQPNLLENFVIYLSRSLSVVSQQPVADQFNRQMVAVVLFRHKPDR